MQVEMIDKCDVRAGVLPGMAMLYLLKVISRRNFITTSSLYDMQTSDKQKLVHIV